MADHCPTFDDETPASGPPRFDDHVAACPRCQREAEADLALRELLGGEQPRLSTSFDRRLEVALARAEDLRRTRRRSRRLLQLYWLLATVASVAVLARLAWPPHGPAPLPALVVPIVVGTLLPVALLLVAVREDPIDLLFETVDWFS